MCSCLATARAIPSRHTWSTTARTYGRYANPASRALSVSRKDRGAILPLGRAKQRHLTPYDVVVIASMIEREVRVPAERPLVAAVFLNRLRLGMPLQADPTVIYGLTSFDGDIRRAPPVAGKKRPQPAGSVKFDNGRDQG